MSFNKPHKPRRPEVKKRVYPTTRKYGKRGSYKKFRLKIPPIVDFWAMIFQDYVQDIGNELLEETHKLIDFI